MGVSSPLHHFSAGASYGVRLDPGEVTEVVAAGVRLAHPLQVLDFHYRKPELSGR